MLVLHCDERLLIELEKALEEAGFDTTTTWEFREAVGLLSARRFDLVLAGVHPPHVTCNDLFSSLRKLNPAARCVILHPVPLPFIAERFCSFGAAAVVSSRHLSDALRAVKNCIDLPMHHATAAAAE